MRIERTALAACTLLVALVSIACSGEPGTGQQAAASVAAASAAPSATPEVSLPPIDGPVVIPDAFQGTWSAEVATGNPSTGTWTLRITADDMELLNPRAESDAEYFSINPRTVSETDLSLYPDVDCPAATYQWSLDADTLTLTPVDDACLDRHDVLSSSWIREVAVAS